MKILVAYASRHGATRGIAERLAQRLERNGLDVTLEHVDRVGAVDDYDAFVIGSAAYNHHWLKEATRFARRHRTRLESRPVWLFSSGPIGTATVDATGQDPLKAAVPREFAELAAAVRPRDLKIFYGAYDPSAPPIGLVERLGAPFMRMAAVRDAMPSGDFRDWAAIDEWAAGIARELGRVPAGTAGGA